jgi:hypothetical protein
MKMPDDVPERFDCLATAAVLRSGSSLSLAAHVAIVVTMLSAANGVLIKCCALLVWCAVVYLTIRVKIDARFFELLAVHPAEQLDQWLAAAGLRKNTLPRTIPERRRGALRMWRALAAAVVMQIALLLPGLLRPLV